MTATSKSGCRSQTNQEPLWALGDRGSSGADAAVGFVVVVVVVVGGNGGVEISGAGGVSGVFGVDAALLASFRLVNNFIFPVNGFSLKAFIFSFRE